MSILRQSALLTADAGHTGHPPVLTVAPAAWLSWATGNSTVFLWRCRSRAGSPARPPLAGALPGHDDAPGHERGYRLGPVLLGSPGPGRAVGYRAAGPGDRDQLPPFPHGRRLPAVTVPVRCRAGLPLLAAAAAGGCGPGGHGRDLPAPRARARAAVEGVKGSAKTCDIHHYPHLPPEAAGRPCASRPWRRTPAPFTGTERGPAAPDTIAGVFGDLTLAEPGLTDVWACTGRLADSNDAYSQTRITLCSVTRPVGPQRIVRFSVTRATTP